MYIGDHLYTGMCQRGGQGGHVPPQILADQKAPPAGGGAPHYCVPPQIFRLWHMPATFGQINSIELLCYVTWN